ncbi:hypothetical protein P8C59_003060 [Phyllachora maydis]|uniref:NADH dehydrogenase [ubiquinone] 1 beta subcomplex subunit 3 n=1 Tax=Phyllachora maydis TaxID=1825666 RepID=A0AAD9I0P1_9PEZI|nr:hypothetical protein P8C59_003060 [Phyllachora maydis]
MYPTRNLRNSHPKPNPTGFDIRRLAAAATERRYDPWERAEAWRGTGEFTRFNRFRRALPGFGIASVAFAVYCAYEHFVMKPAAHHGDGHREGHGEEHH